MTGIRSKHRAAADPAWSLPMPMLRKHVAADCPRMLANLMHDPCGAHFPDLSRL